MDKRRVEFEYIKKMSKFYQNWIKNEFSKDVEVKSDEIITKPRNIFQRLDTHTLLKDHRNRGESIYHFYLSHFRPFWTDCTCEGYHAANFGMIWWQRPKNENDILYLAEKNCTMVSHEIAHEMLRMAGKKDYMEVVHGIWTRHLFADLPFTQYGESFEKTNHKPSYLTIDTSQIRL